METELDSIAKKNTEQKLDAAQKKLNIKIIKGKEYRKVKQIDPNKPDIFRLKSNKKAPIPKGYPRKSQLETIKKINKRKKFAGGGIATRGLGRAFKKGGKV
jgi:hypothetical protein